MSSLASVKRKNACVWVSCASGTKKRTGKMKTVVPECGDCGQLASQTFHLAFKGETQSMA